MSGDDSRRFQTTHWTLILSAQGESPTAKEALRELCMAYYAPVENFIRHVRPRNSDVRDLTHAFFARLLEGQSLRHVDRVEGRFRNYLLGAVKHFLGDIRDHESAQRRGGGRHLDPLDLPGSSGVTPCEVLADPEGFPPDAYFDRQWALTLLDQAVTQLRDEAEREGTGQRFEKLLPWLLPKEDAGNRDDVLRALNWNENVFHVAVHRLRKRFRKCILERISATIDESTSVDEELQYLISALTYAASEDQSPLHG